MKLDIDLVSNEKEAIRYLIEKGEVKIDKVNKKQHESFSIYFYTDNQISFEYLKSVKTSGEKKFLKIEEVKIENPLPNEYTYEEVRNYLLDESKTDEEKIKYINKLFKEYFEYFADPDKEYWEVDWRWLWGENMEKEFVLNKNEVIKYTTFPGAIEIRKNNEKLKEYFYFSIDSYNEISFGFTKIIEVSGVAKSLDIPKAFVTNPLTYKYTYESVRDFLTNESKSDKQKIKFIENLLQDYFEYYRKRKSLYINDEWGE